MALAVAETVSNNDQAQRSAVTCLRNTALWYPSVPDQDLHLNETSFTGELPSVSGYRPLAWMLFGGLDGERLSSITGVAVQCGGIIGSIEFTYATGCSTIQKLGRRRSFQPKDIRWFPIDGARGEIITELSYSVERDAREGVWSFLQHGSLSSFQVRTNLI